MLKKFQKISKNGQRGISTSFRVPAIKAGENTPHKIKKKNIFSGCFQCQKQFQTAFGTTRWKSFAQFKDFFGSNMLVYKLIIKTEM